jgi:hypothetical protein
MEKLIVVALALLICAAALAGKDDASDPFAIMAERDRLAAESLWPGFDSREYPVAIFDGERTLLFHHPSPPEGFVELEDHKGVWSMIGRHPAVVANTSTDLGGVRTATLMLEEGGKGSVKDLAAVVIHETFHVFQGKHYPGWGANEAELFLYPVEDAEKLSLRRLETDALVRALEAGEAEESAGWAAVGMKLRGERYQGMPEGSIAYERGTELLEGTAHYVEFLAAGKEPGSILSERGFAPDDVRRRCYATGTAFALLLDRIDPKWKAGIKEGDVPALDILLDKALAEKSPPKCEFTGEQREAALTRAKTDVAELLEGRAALRREFESMEGWKVVITADEGAPLMLKGFDPMNVCRLSETEVLHTRFLKLGNDAGALEVMNRKSMTEAVGGHPLFSGVGRITVAGIPNEPRVAVSGDKATISGDGFDAEFLGARVTRSDRCVEIALGE